MFIIEGNKSVQQFRNLFITCLVKDKSLKLIEALKFLKKYFDIISLEINDVVYNPSPFLIVILQSTFYMRLHQKQFW